MRYAIQIPSQLSSHLRALRKTQGLSQAELGVRLGLSQTRIARIEGDPLSISVAQLLQVLSALGVQMALDPLPSLSAQSTSPPIKMTPGVVPEADW
jgi:HTH-type transcriptional regulator/antitoxin HipB